MADLAHDASGPASSEPAGITQQAKQPVSSDRGKLRVFISYSRDDLDFADQLTAALDLSGFECFIDREGISGGEEWKRSLGGLIREADTVIFVLTPNSAHSPICDWEVEEATRLNKRILPILCRPLEGVSPPPRLQELNYIFFYKAPCSQKTTRKRWPSRIAPTRFFRITLGSNLTGRMHSCSWGTMKRQKHSTLSARGGPRTVG
jgi:hypothetical protein